VATKSTDGFNRFAAGNKTYGGGRPMPTVGKVDPIGYRERDLKAAAKRKLAQGTK
jgi:hypothetical protein